MKSLIFILSFSALASLLKADNAEIELKAAVEAVADAPKGSYAPEKVATALTAFIKADKFSPSPEVSMNIKLAVKAADLILIDKSQNAREERLKAIEKLLEKISANIEENYIEEMIPTNVGPPAGTPNAIGGMNPDAIQDPELKKQFLDKIKENQNKNFKNRQQASLREAKRHIAFTIAGMTTVEGGLSRKEALERFGKDRETKGLIEQYTQ
jgi:hypothetical protein